MPNIRTILKTIKPFLGRLDVTIDRGRQIIFFQRNGQTEILTVNQLFDEIESVFRQARPAAQQRPEALQLERRSAPWLPILTNPVTNPLGNQGQAVIEPARPLAALLS